MPTIETFPAQAQWLSPQLATTVVSGTVLVRPRPLSLIFVTPHAGVTVQLRLPAPGAWQVPAVPGAALLPALSPVPAQNMVPAPRLWVRTAPRPGASQWLPLAAALGFTAGTLSPPVPPVTGAWLTPAATVVFLFPVPALLQAQTLAAAMHLFAEQPVILAQWATPAASLQVIGQGRAMPSLTLVLLRLAAGLPIDDPSILPPEYHT